MSLAAFNAETVSGEGAHGLDRSKLAKWNHCRTNRQRRQSAPGSLASGWAPVTSACWPWQCVAHLLRPVGHQP